MLLGGGLIKIVSSETEFVELIRAKAPEFRELPRTEGSAVAPPA